MAEPEPEPSRTEPTNGEGNEPTGSWLTYAAAGERFGLSTDAVRMRAKRLGWRTQPGNDGRTLVWIEGTAHEPTPELPELEAEQPEAGLLPQAVAALEAAVMLLGEQLAGAEARAAAERDRAEAEQAKANRLAERLDVAEAELVARGAAIDDAEERANRADAARQEAQEAADELRRGIEEQKARGRWARLRAAWRGE